ncbi:MAG: STAS domain-containing protein [Candidatus Eisenbacteria bacterium]|uniref:STAS domain-containing protein n=1 Tax=Eiseniibacteriota bacterium TaxID=2212470 RepID=A0A9D6QPN9_UNCEI|nr:STAS domain-containing protein [Candidatus Eisenbacteria bacterium]MBI3540129.1 STAS domain-containing protein [Candidatus Eisenbacteria bacterium]
MSVRRRVEAGVTVIQAGGEFWGGDETDQLRKAILDEAVGGNTRLLLDLSECSMMNSTAIGVLVEAYRNYAGRNASIKLCGLQRRMTSALVVAKLINIFGHYPTQVEALAAFAMSPADA